MFEWIKKTVSAKFQNQVKFFNFQLSSYNDLDLINILKNRWKLVGSENNKKWILRDTEISSHKLKFKIIHEFGISFKHCTGKNFIAVISTV